MINKNKYIFEMNSTPSYEGVETEITMIDKESKDFVGKVIFVEREDFDTVETFHLELDGLEVSEVENFTERFIWIERVFISEDYRQLKLGYFMLKNVLDLISNYFEGSINIVGLQASPDKRSLSLDSLIKFYEKLGFSVAENLSHQSSVFMLKNI